MTAEPSNDRGPWAPARLLNDLAHTFVHGFESDDDTRARLGRGLEILRQILPSNRVALLDASPGADHTVVTLPEISGAAGAELTATLEELLALLSERRETPSSERASTPQLAKRPWRAHLAVPLIGLDQVMGLLFVARDEVPYGAEDLCLLSVVAAQIAVYLAALRLHHEKDEFIATLSHELRTPLTAVVGWAALLRAGTLPEASRVRAVDAISRNATTLTRLTEDILDISRIATGKLRVDLRPIVAAQVVEVAVDAARTHAESRAIHLECEIDRAARWLMGDAERLQQVVSNLLTNALKFTPRGGKVWVRVDHGADHVHIEVRDTGKGISAAFLPYVFDRSRQAGSSSRRGADGLGLGLSIVRSLVQLHGGRVRAESDGPGQGAVFTVVLPLAPEGTEPGEMAAPMHTPM